MPAGMPSIAATPVETSTSTTCCSIRRSELGLVRQPEVQQPAHDAPSTSGGRLSVSSSTLTRGSRDRATAAGAVADDELAGVEHANAPRQRERLGHVVGHEDHRRLQLPLNPEEFALQLHTRHRIQRAKRLVHQEDRRIDGERAGHAHALALAARELRGPARGEGGRGKVDQFEQRVRARASAVGGPSLQARHQADVFLDGHVRKQADVLEHVADAAPQPDAVPLAGVAILHPNGSGGRQDQAIHQLQDGALSGAAASDEDHDFPRFDRQREPAEHRRSFGVAKVGSFELNNGRRSHGAT